MRLEFTVNGAEEAIEIDPRHTLADVLRETLGLTGLHLACEQGICGACSILLDGQPARACTLLAAACQGREIRTVEGFDDDPRMARLRRLFHEEHALQCGFCTPGMLVGAWDVSARLDAPDEAEIRREMAGNLCRCTGYVGITRAVARMIEEEAAAGAEG